MPSAVDDRGAEWLARLRGDAFEREEALFQLRALITTVACFELERRRGAVCSLTRAEAARLVRDASESACSRLLARLPHYHGQSRFNVWAAKFAIRETAAAIRALEVRPHADSALSELTHARSGKEVSGGHACRPATDSDTASRGVG